MVPVTVTVPLYLIHSSPFKKGASDNATRFSTGSKPLLAGSIVQGNGDGGAIIAMDGASF